MARTATPTGTVKTAAKTATKSAARTATAAAGKVTTSAKKTVTAAKRSAGATTRSAAKRAPTAAKTRASAIARSRPRGPDALQLLIDDHGTVEALFKRFEGLGPRADKAREEIVGRVIEELSAHAAIEEQTFYPVIRQAKGLEDITLEALEEHHIVKWVLSELEKMSSSDERYEAKFSVMMENVRHHVEEEEGEMFPEVRKALSREQLQTLGAALAEAKKSAPRRPHPRMPDTPPGNLLAGAISGPLDAARSAGLNAVDQVRKFADRAVDAARR